MKVICPQCQKPIEWQESKYRPFCSERCKLLDLGDWATEKYKIAGEKVEAIDNADSEDDEKNGPH